MALKIRLARAGSKKRPYYHIVIADVRSPRDGRFIETVGAWNPMLAKDAERVKIDEEEPVAVLIADVFDANHGFERCEVAAAE